MSGRLVILGAGESGVGAALLGVHKGWDVFVSDKSAIADKFKNELLEAGIQFEEGKHTEDLIMNADVVVKSPGIPDTIALIQKFNESGVEVISEIEFASRYYEGKVVAITGSNGKTTTTKWTYHILKSAGLNVGIGGNIGTSFARQLCDTNYDIFVLELSSFQLDGIKKFRPNIAVLLNITPDHLDRYGYDFGNYVKSKFQITQNQQPGDTFIYNKDDQAIQAYIKNNSIVGRAIPFSVEEKVEGEGAYIENQEININTNNNHFSMSIHKLALQGKHNAGNSMASGITAKLLEVRNEQLRETLSDFEKIEHRLESLGRINDRTFINDSKATNVNSAWYALDSVEDEIVWIAGGVDKGNDYNELMPLVEAKVKAIVCLGKDNSKLINAFSGVVNQMVEVDNAMDAVREAYELSSKGNTILLSPACASFDLFESYEDRGRQFKAAVRSL